MLWRSRFASAFCSFHSESAVSFPPALPLERLHLSDQIEFETAQLPAKIQVSNVFVAPQDVQAFLQDSPASVTEHSIRLVLEGLEPRTRWDSRT